jgi:mannose-6-phosphate isomerase
MTILPPLILERKLDCRIWGGQRLGAWLGLANPPERLAESWQVYEQNRVIGGPFAGRTLADLVVEHRAALIGQRSYARYGADFPLLAKFIDAADHLSIQVHPGDHYAHTVEAASGFHGKTEAWYILAAEPGAELIHGLRTHSNRASFREAVEQGMLMSQLRRVPAAPGDTIYVPAGTIHAINAGIMLFEIQQKSDLTYRVYDYNRRDSNGELRQLHLERALDVIDYNATPPAHVAPQPLGRGRELLVRCPYFAMERWRFTTPVDAAVDPVSFEILTAIDGAAVLGWQNGELRLARGESVVLPATLGGYQVYPDRSTTLLRCYVPG